MVNSDRYPSIKSVFKKDPDTHKILSGEFSVPEFRYLQDCRWIFTEKIDGISVRVVLDDTVVFEKWPGATYLPEPLLRHLRHLFGNEDKLSEYAEYGAGLCLYGEGAGAAIQCGVKYNSTQFFTLFDVMTEYGWVSRQDMFDIARHLQIPIVPIIFEGTLADAVTLVNIGLKSTYGDFFAEGLVGRPESELLNRYGKRIICQIKHKDFYQGS